MATQTKTRRRLQWETTGEGDARALWGCGSGAYVYRIEHPAGWTADDLAALFVDGRAPDAWLLVLSEPDHPSRRLGTFADLPAARAAAEEHWQAVPAYKLVMGKRKREATA